MNMKRAVKRVLAIMLTLVLVISGVNVPELRAKAATEIDLSDYITMSGTTAGATTDGGGAVIELLFNLPSDMDEKTEWDALGINSLTIEYSVTSYTSSMEYPGAMLFFMSNAGGSTWQTDNWANMTTTGTMTNTLNVADLNWGGGNKVSKLGLQFANLDEGSTVTYTINSVKFSSEAVSSGDSGNSGGSSSVNIPSGNLTDYNYDDVDYNYAKLLQYSLYFYDANMCGDEVTEKSLHSWRNDCHTYDKYTYTRSDGTVVNVDLTGGFHDAGDHVKFGLPEAYAAFTLGMSYDTNKSAYVAAKQEEHLETITTHFADYLVDCTVLNSEGTAVEAFCVQVGNGGAGYDHGYWGAPEDQQQGNRTAYFTSASAPHTDIVSLSAAALAMQYKNFGGDEYLNTAKMLFAYAKNNSKSVGTTAGSYYTSSNWEDDYCLAALMLYQITGDSTYQAEYNNYKNVEAAMKPYWPLGWDNVGPAVAYYAGDSSKLNTLMGISNGNSTYGGYRCLDDWGSARYNTSMQYTGLLYDKLTSSDSYRGWAEGQMKFLLGNNSSKQCFVIGYNDYGPKYPHHRAASGYSGSVQSTATPAHTLLGALVGGPNTSGVYTDSATDYYSNEVAIDYNATLVAAAAAIYEDYTADTTNQYVDTNYHVDSSSSSGGETEAGETMSLAITGTFDYDQAYKILELVNQKRAASGKSALTMDKDLLDAAMERSAEIAIYFEHERPNGESCFTACAKMNGENAAIDYNAASVMDGWMNSEGHKENILDSGYKSIGIGVFVNGGRTYYIQCFSNSGATTTTKPENKVDTATVEVLTSRINNTTFKFGSSSYSVKAGNTGNTKILMQNTSALAPSFYAELAPSNFTYTMNSTAVATVKDGVITPVANGSTTLTAKLNALTAKQVSAAVTISGFVESVSLNKSTLTLDTNGTKTATLTATVSPTTATDKTVSWRSSNSGVASVSASGVVTAVSPGVATITVTTNSGGKTATCEVTVWETQIAPAAPTGTANTNSIVLNTMDGCEYSMNKSTWTTNTTFTGLTPNTEYTFYARKAANGYYKVSPASNGTVIKTLPIDATSVALDKTTLNFEIGGENEVTTETLKATVSPSDSTYKKITWTTSNNKVATVDANGKVTAVGPGEATITAKVNEGTKKPSTTCIVTVWKTPDVPAESPSTSTTPTSDTIILTPQEGCEYRIAPDGQWQDSNVFTGLEAGREYAFEVRIKADEDNNIRAGEIATIKVSTIPEGEQAVSVTGIAFDDKLSESCTITIGESDAWSFKASVTPADATNQAITYASSDKSVATIDSDGKLIALAPGYTEITATSAEGGYKDTIKLTVKKKHDTPAAPTLTSKTTTTVTLNKVDGCQYSKDGVNWQSSNVFTGLTPDTQYTFYVKKVASGYWLESDKSGGLVVTTDKVTTGGTTGGDSGNTGGTTGGDSGTTGGTTGGNSGNDSGTAIPFEAPDLKVSYRTHIQTFGWEGKEDDIKTWKSNGTMSGTSGKSKRLEGINIVVEPTTACEDLDLGIQYTTHCQSYGWLPWSADGDMNGTEGEAKRLEAIMIQLTGEHADYYDVYYRVHAQTYGWLGWAKNGEPSGTAGYGKRLEGIQIVVVKKGEDFDRKMGNITSKSSKAFEAKTGSSPIVNYPATSNTKPVVPGAEDVNVAYRTHVQSFGWQGWKYNGQMSGTSGLAKRLEGIEINITNKDYDGGVAYCTHVQTYGWQGAKLDDPTTWKQDGDMAGTSGQAKRLEAICITLTGEMAEHYDIYYRVHAQSYGWLGWAKNGDPAGTAGYAKRLEGIQIVVVPKGEAGPAKTYMGVTSVKDQPYVEK